MMKRLINLYHLIQCLLGKGFYALDVYGPSQHEI